MVIMIENMEAAATPCMVRPIRKVFFRPT
jgi:hypothetical protein